METEKKIFFKEVVIVQAEFNNKWQTTDTRRKMFKVIFTDGSVWFPRDIHLLEILHAKMRVYNHNINFPNIDKKPEV